MFASPLKHPLALQLIFLFLVVGWQVCGVTLRLNGLPPLGPTASLAVAAQALAFAAALCAAARWAPISFAILSITTGTLAISAIANSVTAVDPSLWPSPSARMTGILINTLGVAGMIWSVVGYLRWRAQWHTRSSPTAG